MSNIPEAGFPSEAEIKAIGAIADATRRNRWITWSYFRLDQALKPVTGAADLSWCGFAVWASNTAGGFISEDAFPKILTDWVNQTYKNAGPLELAALLFLDVIGAPIHGLAKKILGSVSGAIGDGNQAVFLDIAPPFARLLTLLKGRPRLDPAERAWFLESLRSEQNKDAEKGLKHAFTALLDGMEETDPKLRAERVLLANAWIGWVEQTLVQPFIVRSMNAPIAQLLFDAFDLHISVHGSRVVSLLPAAAVRKLLAPLVALVELMFRDIETVYMMQLNTPTTTFHLGRDVPPLAPGQPFPPDLTTIASADLDDLLMLLHAQQLQGTAADDWCSFDQRMRYIGTLFRSRQQDPSLRSRPSPPPLPVPYPAA